MSNKFLYWHFPESVSLPFINYFLDESTRCATEKGKINSEHLDQSVRNVETRNINEYNNFSLLMLGYGIKANNIYFKYRISGAYQHELLTYYNEGGKYKGHIDSLQINQDIERKLTVLCFLNHDFVGGDFYLQVETDKKIYYPAKAGSVLVFPSHIMHGVEEVQEGIRQTFVTWLVGPNFR